MKFFLGGLALSVILALAARIFGKLNRALVVRASVGAVAAGVLLLCQPWGFLFWLEPFRVDAENPFWARIQALCMELYGHSFGILVLGTIWFVVSVHFQKPAERS